jgi:hypothetical protein
MMRSLSFLETLVDEKIREAYIEVVDPERNKHERTGPTSQASLGRMVGPMAAGKRIAAFRIRGMMLQRPPTSVL